MIGSGAARAKRGCSALASRKGPLSRHIEIKPAALLPEDAGTAPWAPHTPSCSSPTVPEGGDRWAVRSIPALREQPCLIRTQVEAVLRASRTRGLGNEAETSSLPRCEDLRHCQGCSPGGGPERGMEQAQEAEAGRQEAWLGTQAAPGAACPRKKPRLPSWAMTSQGGQQASSTWPWIRPTP